MIVPSKVVGITFNLEAEVPRKVPITLAANKSFHFERINETKLNHLLLENQNGEYKLKLLGPNGESVSDKKIILSFEFPTHYSNTQLELVTDE